MADRLEPLEQALYLSFIVRPQQLVLRRRELAALYSRRQNLAPELLVRDSVYQGILGAPPKMAKEAFTGIDIARVDQHHPAVPRERQMDNEG
jgi:hypothetical protein